MENCGMDRNLCDCAHDTQNLRAEYYRSTTGTPTLSHNKCNSWVHRLHVLHLGIFVAFEEEGKNSAQCAVPYGNLISVTSRAGGRRYDRKDRGMP